MKKIYVTDMHGDYSGHAFGKERTVAEIAMGHALARAAYTDLLARKDALPE